MPNFALNFEKSFWEQSPNEMRQQVLNKRIHDAAVCLKLLREDEPLPKDMQLEIYQSVGTISIGVGIPKSTIT